MSLSEGHAIGKGIAVARLHRAAAPRGTSPRAKELGDGGGKARDETSWV